MYFENKKDAKKRIDYLMEKLNINTELISRESNADNNVLSAGEKQKINLLRAFYKQSRILILDEPFASLDRNTKTLLETLIEEEREKRIIILISHENEINVNSENQYIISEYTKSDGRQ